MDDRSARGGINFDGALNLTGDLVAGDKKVYLPLPPLDALHQLRAPLADFTGRGDEIAQLKQMLVSGGTASVTGIRGMGGVGKTELAVKVADELRAQYPDAQLVLDLRGLDVPPRDPADALAEAVRAFVGIAQKLPESADELTKLYRSCLAGKRALILLDNAANEAQVRPFLPPPGSALLITSRQPLPFPTVSLDELTPKEARALLQKIEPRVSDAPADEICRLCGYLPLAVRAAGSLLVTTPDLKPAAYAEQLRDESKRLEKLGTAGVPLGVEASFGLSYAQLDGESARVFRTLAVFPAPFEGGAEEEIAADAEHARLSELVRRGLVLYDETEERYRLHDLIRLFADSKRDAPAREADALLHAQYYIQVAYAAHELYEQGGESVLQGLALFDRELPQLRAAFEWLAGGKDAENADKKARLLMLLVNAVGYTGDLRFHPRERIRWLEAQLYAARQLNDKEAEGYALGNLGNAYAALGDARRAIEYYEQALAIAREIGDRRGEGLDLGNLGLANADLGDARRAIEYHEQALAIRREIGDRRGEGTALGNLGNAYAALGDARRAIEYYEQQLVITREIGDRRGEGAALGNLGLANADLGDARRAIEYYEQALAIDREIGDRRGEGLDLGNLGLANADLGDARRAIEYYEQALAIDREIGDRRGEGNALGNLGIAYKNLGDVRRAIEYHEQALAIDREIGVRRGEGQDLGNLGLAYADLGDVRRAIEYYEQQLVITREIGDRRGEGNTLVNLGSAYYALGDARRAIEYYEQQLAIAREIGDRRGEGNALTGLGLAYAALGDARRAIEYYEQALAIAREIGDRRGEEAVLGNLGNAYADLGDARRAIEYYDQHLAIAREIGDRRGEGNALGNLGNAYAALGDVRRAIEYYEKQLVITREIGDRSGEGRGCFNLSLVQEQLGNLALALQYAERAVEIAQATESPRLQSRQEQVADLKRKIAEKK